jgi:hypothetical protein
VLVREAAEELPMEQPAQVFGHPWQLSLKQVGGTIHGKELWVDSYSGCSGATIFAGDDIVGMYQGHSNTKYSGVPCFDDGADCNSSSRCFPGPGIFTAYEKIQEALDVVRECECAGLSVCEPDACGEPFGKILKFWDAAKYDLKFQSDQ